MCPAPADFQSFDAGYQESCAVDSALHPQTLVAFMREGRPLSSWYGAPARVHYPVKLGYKNTNLCRCHLWCQPLCQSCAPDRARRTLRVTNYQENLALRTSARCAGRSSAR